MSTENKTVDLHVGPAGLEKAKQFARNHVDSQINIHVDESMMGDTWFIETPYRFVPTANKVGETPLTLEQALRDVEALKSDPSDTLAISASNAMDRAVKKWGIPSMQRAADTVSRVIHKVLKGA